MTEPAGLGISWLWKLPDSHPFFEAGIKHDAAYDKMELSSSYQADKIFLEDCLKVAGNSYKLKAQAYLFYILCRIWGFFKWKQKRT